MSGADMAESTTPAPPNAPANDLPFPHERPAFVAPKDLLAHSGPIIPPKPVTALDKEQLEGLVRNPRARHGSWAVGRVPVQD